MSAKMIQSLRRFAERYPNVEVGIACKGTALESSSFKIAKKNFLFLRPAELMLKLAASLNEATRFAEQHPDQCKVGAGGWVTFRFGAEPAPEDLLKKWIDESYRIFAVPKPAAGTKKKAKSKKARG